MPITPTVTTIIVLLQPTAKVAQDHLTPADLLSHMANTPSKTLDTHNSYINTPVVIVMDTSRQDMTITDRSTTPKRNMRNIHHTINITPAEDQAVALMVLDSVALGHSPFDQEEPTCSPHLPCVALRLVALVP